MAGETGSLQGKVALVTGCGRMNGLGRAIAVALAQAGADVAVTDIESGGTRNALDSGGDEARAGWRGLASVVTEIEALGRRARALTGDVGLSADVERMVDQTIANFGGIDILVNNAGAPHGADRNLTWEVPEEAWDLVMRVNAKGAFLMSSAVTRHFIARGGPGRIINIASTSGRQGIARRAAYSASKFAIIGLTQVMALELAPRGITVNAVCPGPVATSRSESTRARAAAGMEPGHLGMQLTSTPVGRIGQPRDVARTVVFLAAPAADFITGQAFGVNGGTQMI